MTRPAISLSRGNSEHPASGLGIGYGQSAATTNGNVASQKMLAKAGFVPAGPARPGGRPGTWYVRDLAVG